ncbi:hypothetical protein MMC06_005469 [Schaereria dolodes]|nr:hypothetical protein [Schaereria dolodes]
MALSRAVVAAQEMGLLARDSGSCAASGFTPCNQGLPSEFCCGSNTTCIAFNNGASAICCPAGQNCENILPIPCDITQLNATKYPSNPLHSTDLSGNLPTCGGNTCCPQGYTCQGGQCFLSNNTSASSTTSSSSPSSTSASTATTNIPNLVTTPAPSSVASQAAVTQTPAPDNHCNDFPATAIIAGFFPGLVAGILLTILIIICIGRRNSKRESGDFGHVSATVSDPIYQDQSATRTDFLRRESKSRNRTSRVRSLFSRSPTLVKRRTPPGEVLGQGFTTPEPRNGTKREPSMESIKIYSPPDGRLGRQTTFMDMMENAGFRKDEPYLGSPGRVDPRSRGAAGHL